MLTRDELQDRLLDFVRSELVSADLSERIAPATRLFEERLVDSLKILELIAFLESETGQRIPDAQVVLANFRTIETMARVFSTGVNGRQRRPRRSRGARAVRHHFEPSVVLSEAGATPNADGGLDLNGPALSLAKYLDSQATAWAREMGAVEEVFADTIAVSTLERAGFVEAFPQKLLRVDGEPDYALPPAVCYHHYPRLTNRTIEERGSIITAAGGCFRNEHDDAHPLERLRSFTMREIIAVGSAAFVEEMRAGLVARVMQWLAQLDLDGVIETATDPFFTSESRGRLLMQQLQPLKYELRLTVNDAGRTVAAASFNNHRDHFGKAFSIRQRNGEFAHSGCVAFGWERWILAFIAQHGADEDSWPVQSRRRHAVAI